LDKPGAEKDPQTQFLEFIDSSSNRSKSKIVLALDLDFRKDTSTLVKEASNIFEATRKFICAVKLNFHLILPLSLGELSDLNRKFNESGIPSIADIKLNDIANTNRVAVDYLWAAGFAAVIVNPFVGYEGGLDVILKRSKELGKGVITLAYMSHPGADEGYGLELKSGGTLFDKFLQRASEWNVDGIIVGSTRPERISYAKKSVAHSVRIFSPGSGAQGGNAKDSIDAGSDFLIFGRSIVDSGNPGLAAKEIHSAMLPSILGKRQHHEARS